MSLSTIEEFKADMLIDAQLQITSLLRVVVREEEKMLLSIYFDDAIAFIQKRKRLTFNDFDRIISGEFNMIIRLFIVRSHRYNGSEGTKSQGRGGGLFDMTPQQYLELSVLQEGV